MGILTLSSSDSSDVSVNGTVKVVKEYVQVEKLVEVPVEVIREVVVTKEVEVIKEVVVEKLVPVDRPVPQIQYVDKVEYIDVVKEKVIEIPKIYFKPVIPLWLASLSIIEGIVILGLMGVLLI